MLVIIAARCMTTNLFMWKQRLVFHCPINASFLCFLAVYPAAAFVQSCLVFFFVCVCVKYKSFNLVLFFFSMVLIDLQFLRRKSVLGIRVI